MKVASLHYDVIFKKAFGNINIFKALVKDFLGIDLDIDKIETEKKFGPPVGKVDSRFDLYAEDLKNRVIVDMQHRRYNDHYDRFLHYHCTALLEQITSSKNYSPTLTVFTIVISTSKSREEVAMAEINFDPFDFLTGQRLHKIHHRVLYLFPKHVHEKVPEPYRQWLKLIEDSLDENVEISSYNKPEFQQILNLIKVEDLTPGELARMKDENALEGGLRLEKEEEFKKGVKLGEQLGEQRGLEKGIEFGEQRGLEKGIELGEQRGLEKGKLEVAHKLLEIAHKLQAQRTSVELIEQITGLSRDQWQ